jgi:hypothetical protein
MSILSKLVVGAAATVALLGVVKAKKSKKASKTAEKASKTAEKPAKRSKARKHGGSSKKRGKKAA